jgi:hypothetical protein
MQHMMAMGAVRTRRYQIEDGSWLFFRLQNHDGQSMNEHIDKAAHNEPQHGKQNEGF